MENTYFKYADDLLHAIEELLRRKVGQFAVARASEQGWNLTYPKQAEPISPLHEA